MFRSSLLLILALAAGTSCSSHTAKASRVFVPPPVMPESVPSRVPPLPTAPNIDARAPAENPEITTGAGLPTIGPPPTPRRTNPPRASIPSPPAPTPAIVEPAPSPRLETILTPDQLRDYNRNMDESLERVKKVLASVTGKRLKPELTTIVGRIQTFQKQAEQARESDLVTAVSLARRADLLAQDLVKRLP